MDEREESSEGRFGGIQKTWMGCLGSFTLSMFGASILTWWELEYHPTNNQQWMVPLGLILFVTPLVVWFSAVVSDFCNSIDGISACQEPYKPFDKGNCLGSHKMSTSPSFPDFV